MKWKQKKTKRLQTHIFDCKTHRQTHIMMSFHPETDYVSSSTDIQNLQKTYQHYAFWQTKTQLQSITTEIVCVLTVDW